MSTSNEKSAVLSTSGVVEVFPEHTNVLTITRPSAARHHPNTAIDVLPTIQACESTRSMTPPPSAHHEKSVIEANSSPYSFLERSESKQNITGPHSVFETDIEGLAHAKTEAGCSKTGLVPIKSKGQSTSNAWPSPNEQKRMMKAKKRSRASCQCWAGMSKTKRNSIKIGVLLLLIGLIIGLCIGVTKVVGGGVFHAS